MTGFAAVSGSGDGYAWNWEIRGVNARGLDLRMRLPERAQPLDGRLRAKVSKRVKRGAVQIGLRLKEDSVAAIAQIDADALAASAATLAQVRDALEAAGLSVAPVDPARVLLLPGLDKSTDQSDFPFDALLADFDTALDAFASMRGEEGQALLSVLQSQLAKIESLVDRARDRVAARNISVAERYRQQVADLVASAGHALDAERLSHDLAALTVKGDVSEEIDRLGAHVSAARALLEGEGPVGRKLDFLMQEFNREANTLCSKSSDTELTQAGLDLKVVIDQMREQVQNLE